MNKDPEDTKLIEELSKLLFLLERRGYIYSELNDEQTYVLNLREMARAAVKRARVRLGLPELKNWR